MQLRRAVLEILRGTRLPKTGSDCAYVACCGKPFQTFYLSSCQHVNRLVSSCF